ncbi:MAG: glycosyltransferase family 4 protein [Leptospira sp.]|nr:glycosyltransferase family 4 protein [Leptospira sp.]
MNFKIGFIGRFVPNKKIEDLISLLYSLRRIDTRYRLVLIGKPSPVFLKYYEYLLSFIALSGLSSSVAIYENPGDEETGKLLSDLDFYVSMSEHEGFGIPLLEAFARGVPVLSFYSSAVPETMRGGGILFRKKTMGYLSELIHSINSKSEIRNKIVESQLKSLEYYNSFPFREKIQEMIRAVQIET